MAAAILSSAPAAWNTLITNLTPYDEGNTAQSRLQAVQIAPQDLALNTVIGANFIPTGATGVGVPGGFSTAIAANFPSEIVQFLNLAQLGWGAQLGSNRRISIQSAALLLREMLTSYINQGCPRLPFGTSLPAGL